MEVNEKELEVKKILCHYVDGDEYDIRNYIDRVRFDKDQYLSRGFEEILILPAKADLESYDSFSETGLFKRKDVEELLSLAKGMVEDVEWIESDFYAIRTCSWCHGHAYQPVAFDEVHIGHEEDCRFLLFNKLYKEIIGND